MKKITSIITKIFGGLNITWPRLIIFSVLIGIYTALMAMFVPDTCSFHDISATLEWWILFAIIIIINSKKPLEAALKTFVFFLVSQPLVYLIQVPFHWMGWGLFQYYPYWFMVTLLTFPGAFVGWYIKKDKWYSGIILAAAMCLLVVTGAMYLGSLIENPPEHLLTVIFCFGLIPFLVFVILKDKIPRVIALAITVVFACIYIPLTAADPYVAYNQYVFEDNNIVLIGEPKISDCPESGEGSVEIIKYDGGYNFKLTGVYGKKYPFTLSDDENEYEMEFYYDDESKSIVVKLINEGASSFLNGFLVSYE